MKRLVTFEAQTTRDRIVEIVQAAGGELEPEFVVIPLDETEVSVEIEASEEACTKLREFPEVTGVFPSSEMTYYE